MDDKPRRTLIEIVRSYGVDILADPRRCRALMMDLCGEYRGEINLVEMALREGVVADLVSRLPRMPRGLVLAQQAQRLEEAYYLPPDAARWAVETCADALVAPESARSQERLLVSEVAAAVLSRPWLAEDVPWEVVGRTPGEVILPAHGAVRVNARLDDAAAARFAKDLISAGDIHELDLSYSTLTAKGLAALLDLPSLIALDLTRSTIGDHGLRVVSGCAGLRRLNLWGAEGVTDLGVGELSQARALTRLELGRCGSLTDHAVQAVCSLPELEILGLSATSISDAALDSLATAACLRRLDLSATALTGRALAALSQLRSLHSLNMSGCVRLRPETLGALRAFRDLSTLQLGRCGLLTSSSLVHLRWLKDLRSLGLEGLDITDAAILYLDGLAGLEVLDLGWTAIGDRGLARLRSLQGLEALSLPGTQITDEGLHHLMGLPNLTYLDLSDTIIGDAGLRVLSGLKALTALDLEGTQIHDAGLVHLGELPALTQLFLGGTAITDVGLALLSRVTQLQEIDLTMCTSLTEEGVEALRHEGVSVSH